MDRFLVRVALQKKPRLRPQSRLPISCTATDKGHHFATYPPQCELCGTESWEYPNQRRVKPDSTCHVHPAAVGADRRKFAEARAEGGAISSVRSWKFIHSDAAAVKRGFILSKEIYLLRSSSHQSKMALAIKRPCANLTEPQTLRSSWSAHSGRRPRSCQ